jgi:hypothetical protein
MTGVCPYFDSERRLSALAGDYHGGYLERDSEVDGDWRKGVEALHRMDGGELLANGFVSRGEIVHT